MLNNLIKVTFCFILFACQQNSEPSFLLLDKIAHLHCEASQLKDKRFSLADSMRYYQDSIRLFPQELDKVKAWQEKVDYQLGRKDLLANQSRDLSDSIRQYLNISTSNMTPEDKRLFNAQLKTKSEENNCP